MVKRKGCRFAAVLLAVLCGLSLFCTAASAAESPLLSGGDGTYRVPVRLDLKMGADNFTTSVTVEKQNGMYYLTFGHSSAISAMTLNPGGVRIGSLTEEKDGWTYYTYTLSESSLAGTLSFSAYINAMAREMSFSASLNLAAAEKISDTVKDLGERPAEYVPVIDTGAAAEYSLKLGTVFPVPAAQAKLGEVPCEVTVTASCNGRAAEITDGKLTLAELGEYRLIYRATSPLYRTSLGNDSFAEYTVVIHSVAGGNELVKWNAPGGTVPDGTAVIAGRVLANSSVYEKAAASMKEIADDFEVFSVELLAENGEHAALTGRFELLFRADDRFDRTKARVYRMAEDGTLTQLPAKGYGRYVLAETDTDGIYIVCVPGVAFHMPMWGYALIAGGILLLIAGAVVLLILRKRRKKARAA